MSELAPELALHPVLDFVSCPDPNGTHRMAYWSWGESSASHVVVCVHGLTRQGRDFDLLARGLVASAKKANLPAIRVVCPDVVGRGQSEWLKEPMSYQFAQYAGDMAVLLQSLHTQHPIERLDWVGTSIALRPCHWGACSRGNARASAGRRGRPLAGLRFDCMPHLAHSWRAIGAVEFECCARHATARPASPSGHHSRRGSCTHPHARGSN